MTIKPLTKRQREVMDFLQKFVKQCGFAPSLEEIGNAMGLSSLATVHKHLENLRERGYVRRAWNRSRSIELIVGEGCCPMCLRPLDLIPAQAKVDADFAMKTESEGVELKAVESGAATPRST